MKIGILTHPFRGNYGGMLQAYALHQVLRRNGHDATILKFLPQQAPPFRSAPLQNLRSRLNLKNRIRLLLFHLNIKSPWTAPLRMLVHQNGQRFQRKYVSSVWIGTEPASQLVERGIEAVVVGSDQVWRAIYARSLRALPFFFLDFAPEAIRRRSIAYAASFGTADWEGNEQETSQCSQLLQQFRAVSVREDSGIDICRQVLGTDAVRMADPTMLLQAEDYNAIIHAEKTRCPAAPYLAAYILDANAETEASVTALAQNTQCRIQQLNASQNARNRKDRFPLSVAQWLRYIRDCKCLVTDSFHGCVFAIIFNKPFICLGNESRGSARFDSLLGTFGLRERLVTNPTPEQLVRLMNTPIEWETVNNIRETGKKKAFAFLRSNLKSC